MTFEVTNEGPNDVHEFVLTATALDVIEFPTVADESGEGMEVIGEIEDIPSAHPGR